MHLKKSGNRLLLAGLKLAAEGYGTIKLKHSPQNAEGISTSEAEGTFGCFRAQEAAGDQYRVAYSTITPAHSFTLSIASDAALLLLAVNLKTEVPLVLNGNPPCTSFQLQNGMFYLPTVRCEMKLKAKKEYIFFFIDFDPAYLAKWDTAKYFPEFFDSVKNKQAAYLCNSRLASVEIIDILDTFFMPKKEYAVKMHREAKVLEILHLFIRDSKDPCVHAVRLTNAERLILQKLRRHILLNLYKKVTPNSLAEKFSMPARKMNAFFLQLNGIDIASFIVREKMRHASKLLVETHLPVKTIMEQAGYSRKENFIRDFEKYIGVTPLGLRTPHNFFLASFENTEGD